MRGSLHVAVFTCAWPVTASKQQLQQQLDAATKEKGELNERLKAEQAQVKCCSPTPQLVADDQWCCYRYC